MHCFYVYIDDLSSMGNDCFVLKINNASCGSDCFDNNYHSYTVTAVAKLPFHNESCQIILQLKDFTVFTKQDSSVWTSE